MTIEAQAVLPAGWYTDPGQSGGKRWWDGSHWTEHLQKAAPVATHTAPKPLSNPYGLNGVVSAPRAPSTDVDGEPIARPVAVSVSNNAAWISLLFGLLAVGFTILPTLPVATILWVGAAAFVSLFFFVVAVARRIAGSSTNVWAPTIGVVLSIAATVSLLAGVGLTSLVSSIAPTVPDASASPSLAGAPRTSAEPFVFPANAELTADEVATQTLATSINRTYAAGNAKLASGMAWPAGLTMHGTIVVAPNGAHLATLPAGLTATYLLNANGTSYHIAIAGTNKAELATYDSSANTFSWSCLANDTTCKPSN